MRAAPGGAWRKRQTSENCKNKCVSKTLPAIWGEQLKLCATSLPPFQGMATSRSLIVCVYLAYSKLLKLTAASSARSSSLRLTKARSILLDGRLRTTLPWRTVALWTSVINKNPLMRDGAHFSGSRLSQIVMEKYSKMQHVFAYNRLPVTYIFRKLSSIWC